MFLDSSDANNEAAAAAGKAFLTTVSPFFIAVAVKLTADGVLRGAGNVRAFMITTLSDLILRVVFAYILTPYFGSQGIWLSWPVGWVTACLISLALYKVQSVRLNKKEETL